MNESELLSKTMAGLELGLKVSSIAAEPLEVCAPYEIASSVLKNPAFSDFDQIPVRDGSRIVGVLERDGKRSGGIRVRRVMRPLDDSILVSADEPLSRFLPNLESPYRLVVTGSEISGIVTFSDVSKLPVRLMAFTLVTHLELLMAEVIRSRCDDDEEYLSLLSHSQRRNVEGRVKRRKRRNLRISPLDLTDFSHKVTIIGHLLELPEFDERLKPIVGLRNSLDHASDFIEECSGVKGFLDRLSVVEELILYLTSYLSGGARHEKEAH